MTPTARSLAECRKRGWTAQVVEKFNSFTKRRIDLFGCIDIVAITPDGIVGIQATSGTNHASRRTKAEQEPRITQWLQAGAGFAIWSWAKRGPRKRWMLRTEWLPGYDCDGHSTQVPA